MPRSMWKGTISFGMVAIPIRLYVATEARSVSFRQLCDSHLSPIRSKRWCEKGDHEVAYSDIRKGYQVGRDRYVVIEDSELENLPLPTTHVIEISEFVPSKSIQGGLYFKSAYYVEPEDVGRKPYHLLRRALDETGMLAVAKIAFRDREHLCALQPADDMVVLTTLHWPEEIRPVDELQGLSESGIKINPNELQMAKSLVQSLAEEHFEPSRYHDEYQRALMRLVEAKTGGEEIVEAEPAVAEPKVMDLMEALKASVQNARQQRAGQRGPTHRQTRRKAG
jgi:DNA end-binding protein Ku